MRISTIIYSMKQGFKNIRRNRMFSAASVGTIGACLFLFGIFYFVVANFQFMVKTAETSVGVTVFFDKGTTQEQMDTIGDEIRTRAEVASITFVSAEETWNNYKEKYLNKELAESFGEDNPLKDSASYTVKLNDVSMQKDLVSFIERLDGVRQVNHSDTIADTFKTFNALVGYVSGAIIIILFGVAIFLINTTVTMGIAVRREEISIMKLIGAKDSFIRAPFIVEGITIGFLGSVIPLVFLYFMYNRLIDYIAGKYNNIFRTFQFIEVNGIFKTLVPLSLILGVGIGFFGSYLTVRKQLRLKEGK
ncbi:MAG: transporter permease [Anaerocolumna sp.]|nr:transporter permease [Anaerocolumna sp.]